MLYTCFRFIGKPCPERPFTHITAVLKTNIRRRLQTMYPEKELVCWFDPLALKVDSNQGCVQVIFPHALFGRWFMSCFRKPFEEQAGPLCANMPFVYEEADHSIYAVDQTAARVLLRAVEETDTSTALPAFALEREPSRTFPAHIFPLAVPPKHQVFDAFLCNRKNDFPLAAAKQAVTDANPSLSYIPFVIYGQSGSGKTHLLSAMAHTVLDLSPETTIYYGNIDLFLPLKPPLAQGPKAFFIDEVQRITQFPEMYERLINFLDTCRAKDITMVLCFDTHPSACKGLPKKIVSRITGGLVVELKTPDIDVRRRYIHEKNTLFSLGLNKDQELTLAQRYLDFRAIDGILARLTAYRNVNASQHIHPAMLLEKGKGAAPLTPAHILTITAQYFSVPENEIIGKSRNKRAVTARQTAMFLIRDLLGLSLMQIGKIFDGRDHSSVLYTLKKIKSLQESDRDMNKHTATLKQLCLSRDA